MGSCMVRYLTHGTLSASTPGIMFALPFSILPAYLYSSTALSKCISALLYEFVMQRKEVVTRHTLAIKAFNDGSRDDRSQNDDSGMRGAL
jgi:hypothetical protein